MPDMKSDRVRRHAVVVFIKSKDRGGKQAQKRLLGYFKHIQHPHDFEIEGVGRITMERLLTEKPIDNDIDS